MHRRIEFSALPAAEEHDAESIAGIELPDEGHIEVEGRTFFDKEKKINLSRS